LGVLATDNLRGAVVQIDAVNTRLPGAVLAIPNCDLVKFIPVVIGLVESTTFAEACQGRKIQRSAFIGR